MIAEFKRLVFSSLRRLSTAYAKRKVSKYGKGFTVNYPCLFTGGTVIGNYCHFNGLKVRGIGRLVIGDYFHSGEDILVITQSHNYKKATLLPYDNNDVGRDVHIGAYVWLGSRVILLPGVQLGDGCVVQAGAVVSGTFPPNSVIGGNPATIIGSRDAALVSRLVAEGKFLL